MKRDVSLSKVMLLYPGVLAKPVTVEVTAPNFVMVASHGVPVHATVPAGIGVRLQDCTSMHRQVKCPRDLSTLLLKSHNRCV